MPGIVTHRVFGGEVYEVLADAVGHTAVQREAFLLGNQGPDPLLCMRYLPGKVRHAKLGSTMHARNSAGLLSAFHEHFVCARDNASAALLKAYALGFACHFFLDSTVHPLVYAQQYAICGSGVEGLGHGKGGVVHAAIETELDEYVLTTHLGLTVTGFVPHEEALASGADELSRISTAYVAVVEDAYGVQVPEGFFTAGVRLYRTLQRVLDAKSSGFRKHVDYARVAGASYQRIQAMTHRDEPRPTSGYANDGHVPWPHPFALGSVVDSSFDELYAQALQRACEWLPRYARESFSTRECQLLTNGVNFQGKPC